MSNLGSLPSPAARDAASGTAVVRPLSRVAERACVRPGCPAPARARLVFRYESRQIWLEGLGERSRPEAYDLCADHARRTRPPHGWELRDRRPPEEQAAPQRPEPPRDLGGEQTVAVLAAALHPVQASGRSAGTDAAADPADVAEADAPTGRREGTSPVLEPTRGGEDPRPPEPAPEVAPERGPVRGPDRDADTRPRPVLAARQRPIEDATAPDAPARNW